MSKAHARSARATLAADVVFVGLTRPAMAIGVPYVAVLANALITIETFLTTRNLLWLLIAVPIHAATALVCAAEPRFFDLLQVWAATRRRAGFRSARRWRSISYGPLPDRAHSVLRIDRDLAPREWP